MPEQHAVLGPSAASRWITCPASVRMSSLVPAKPSSPAAAEGTAAHELGERKARLALGMVDLRGHTAEMKEWERRFGTGVDDTQRADMERHTDAYVELILSRQTATSVTYLEERVHTGVPQCWGTADCVVVDGPFVEIIDLKYGQGVPVSAEGNPQLMLYGLGAYEHFGDIMEDTTHVTMTIFQPRVGGESSTTATVDDLKAWRKYVVIPAAEEALNDPRAHFRPSEAACRWCPAAGICVAQMTHAVAQDFGSPLGESSSDPAVLSPEDLADVLDRLPSVKAWVKHVDKAALDLAYHQGVEIPRWKVVRSHGRRSVKDDAGLVQVAIDAGYHAEDLAQMKVRSLSQLEKVLGDDFDEVAGPFISKSKGSETLVPETDSRQGVTKESEAAAEFGAVDLSPNTDNPN